MAIPEYTQHLKFSTADFRSLNRSFVDLTTLGAREISDLSVTGRFSPSLVMISSAAVHQRTADSMKASLLKLSPKDDGESRCFSRPTSSHHPPSWQTTAATSSSPVPSNRSASAAAAAVDRDLASPPSPPTVVIRSAVGRPSLMPPSASTAVRSSESMTSTAAASGTGDTPLNLTVPKVRICFVRSLFQRVCVVDETSCHVMMSCHAMSCITLNTCQGPEKNS